MLSMDEIFREIDDDVQIQLQHCFMVKGCGERISLPKMECSNKVILQVYSLKEKYQETWDFVYTGLNKLFPIFPRNKWKHLVDTVVAKVQSCPTADRPAFYTEVINLEFLGERCETVGLTRSVLLDPALGRKLVPDEVTNGLLLELLRLTSPAEIYNLLDKLYPGGVSKDDLVKKSRKMCCKHKLLTKKRKKTPELETFMCRPFFMEPEQPAVVSDTGANVEVIKLKKLLKGVQSEHKRTRKQLEDANEKTVHLEEKLKVMEELYRDKSTEVKDLLNEINSANKAINKKDCTIGRIEHKLCELSEKYKKLKDKISPQKVRSLKRKEWYLKQKQKLLRERQRASECAASLQNKQDEGKMQALQKNVSCLKMMLSADQIKKETV